MLSPVHRWPDAVRWIFCASLSLLPGCVNLEPRFPPSTPPAVRGADPALEAQTRLLESAYGAYAQEKYRLASALLRRFVDSNPDSPKLSEARWWLARSYEQDGDLPAALSAYRVAVGEAPGSTLNAGSYEFHALNRLDAVRRRLGSSSLLERRQVALWLTNGHWHTISDLRSWISQLADVGVTALIVETGSSLHDALRAGSPGVYFKTSKVPVIEDLFTMIVPAAHAKGIAVLASLNLHEPGWMPANSEWNIAVPNQRDQMPQSVGQVDVLHPDYQRFVEAVAQDLLRTDIDGLVLEKRKVKGFYGEWSPTSRRMFEELFGRPSDSRDQPVFTENGWRGAGWKTRAYLEYMTRLTRELRQTRPGLVVAVAVHEQAISSPADAMLEYGEDAIETKQRRLHLVVQPEPDMSERSDEQWARLDVARQRFAPAAGDERQLWLGIFLGAMETSSITAGVKAVLTEKVGKAGSHLLLMTRPGIP